MKNLASMVFGLFIPVLLYAEEPAEDAGCKKPEVCCEEKSVGLAKFIAPVEVDYILEEMLFNVVKTKEERVKPISFFLERARDYDGRGGFFKSNPYPYSKPRMGDFLDSIDYVMVERVREEGFLSGSFYKLVEVASALNDIDIVLEWKLKGSENNEHDKRELSRDRWKAANPKLKITGSGARLQLLGVSNKNFELN